MDISALVCEERTFHKTGILIRQYAIGLKKEVFRKSIHLCTLFIPFLLSAAYYPVLSVLCFMLVFYIVAEKLRMKGINVPVISVVTAAAARKRDENRFVLGPVTLCCGIISSAFLFHPAAAAIGIYALGAGDGFASLFGKMFGTLKIPLTGGKSVVGSLTCFFVILIFSFFVCKNVFYSLILAFIGMFVEMLPLKDFDNVFIPVILAFISQYAFGL